ncbi:protein ALP1-like [Chelonus insularis]|uniref:protein ALP1-like n=1 Tax=Chelonus insularis TaxID=460826 RepID=UPI00158F5B43|nr:protein ALP1-like [Chelonus insularis]
MTSSGKIDEYLGELRDFKGSPFYPRNVLGKIPISADISVIIFLWFIGNTEPLRTFSERFDVSISSVFRIIRRVADFLLYKSPDIIKWPQNGQIPNITNKFQLIAGMPNVIGAIDCTHVKIVTPKVNSRDFYNRKKYHSINLQGVVDPEMRFINVYCGEPGSLHDARVLRRSPLYHAANNNQNLLFPMNTHIIGDSVYPIFPWLVKPYKDNGLLIPNERHFNRLISTTRVVVERAFGCLKGRFRRIKFFTEYTDLPFVVKVVMSACVLHNYCINENDTPVDTDEDDDSDFEDPLDENIDGIDHRERLLKLLLNET